MLAGKRASDKPSKLTACKYLTVFTPFFFGYDMDGICLIIFELHFCIFLFPACLARWFLIRRQELLFICLALDLYNPFNFSALWL